jgi:hypothetical protein
VTAVRELGLVQAALERRDDVATQRTGAIDAQAAGAFELRWLLPPMVVGNLLISTFSFIGGLVLLEKGEGTLTAQVITPLRIGEYLAAKIATLTALALAETLVLVLLIAGWRFDALLLILGVILAAAIYCLAGFITVVRYAAINEYLLPSGGYIAVLWLPLRDGKQQLLMSLEHPQALLEALRSAQLSTQRKPR